MRNLQVITDKTAISLSLLCAIHCLALPLIVALLPSLAALGLEDEAFHFWMVIAVIPTSVIALTMGCKKHKRYSVLMIGAVGLCILAAAAFLGEDILSEFWEKGLSLIGTTFIAVGHVWNYRLCRQKVNCDCPENKQREVA